MRRNLDFLTDSEQQLTCEAVSAASCQLHAGVGPPLVYGGKNARLPKPLNPPICSVRLGVCSLEPQVDSIRPPSAAATVGRGSTTTAAAEQAGKAGGAGA